MKTKTALKVTIAAFGLTIAGAYIAYQLSSMSEDRKTRTEVRTARDAKITEIKGLPIAQRTDIVTRATTGQPLATALVDICTFETVDAGWTIQSYEQRCKLRRIEGYASNISIDDLKATGDERAAEVPSEKNVFGEGDWVDGKAKLLSKEGTGWNGEHGLLIWQYADSEYWNEDLGCKTLSIFCDNPRRDPIMAG
jgi:hypothetical protein